VSFPRRFWLLLILTLGFLFTPRTFHAYSVLAHEAVVDAEWDNAIKALLLQRFPNATPAQIQEAHAYAYGGSLIQDMGYYPFGEQRFSNLAHYVRSGDFVMNLLRESTNIDEYAFALGALAHYVGDNVGHPMAVNRSVPIIYSRYKRRYGPSVTYEDGKHVHVLVEFSFDVAQVAGGMYAPQAYHDFIGFMVAKPLLNRAFKRTYGVDVRDVMFDEDLTIWSYRRAAGRLIPHMTVVAWAKERDKIGKVAPGVDRENYIYAVSRRAFKREWGSTYQKPRFLSPRWLRQYRHMSIYARFLVVVFNLIPKIGPLSTFKFRPPTTKTENLFLQSFRVTVNKYTLLLAAQRQGKLELPDTNFDTGLPTRKGDYRMADRAYLELLRRLDREHFHNLTPNLQKNMLTFFAEPGKMKPTLAQRFHSRRTRRELRELKALTPAATPPTATAQATSLPLSAAPNQGGR
jgi:hypothetical protein